MPDERFKVAVFSDHVYDDRGSEPLRADLYVPQGAGRPCPVILWVHGGGWRYGSRRVAPDLTRFFAERGFAMMAIDYRLSDRAVFPAQIEDVKAAVRWVRRAGGGYGLGDRIGLWGASAGGHLSALAALSGPGVFETADAAGEPSSEVQAVVTGYAPVDFLQLDADRPSESAVVVDPENLSLPPGMLSADANSFESLLLGGPIETCPDWVREANPVTYARPGAPPFLILHGLSDTTVGPHQSELLYDALAALGNDVTLCLIEGLGHGFLTRPHLDNGAPWRMTMRSREGDIHRIERTERPVLPMIESFFREHLRARAEA